MANTDPKGHIVTKKTETKYEIDPETYRVIRVISKTTYIYRNDKRIGKIYEGAIYQGLQSVQNQDGSYSLQPRYDYNVKLDTGGFGSLNDIIRRDNADPFRSDSRLSIISRNVGKGILTFSRLLKIRLQDKPLPE